MFFRTVIAAIAQLVARGSHNPKVVSLILTGRISVSVRHGQFRGQHTCAVPNALPIASPRTLAEGMTQPEREDAAGNDDGGESRGFADVAPTRGAWRRAGVRFLTQREQLSRGQREGQGSGGEPGRRQCFAFCTQVLPKATSNAWLLMKQVFL